MRKGEKAKSSLKLNIFEQKFLLGAGRAPKGVLPEKLVGGVRPASQNPYPVYDKNLRYSLPYLWPDQKFKTLFTTWPSNQNPVSDLRYNELASSNQVKLP